MLTKIIRYTEKLKDRPFSFWLTTILIIIILFLISRCFHSSNKQTDLAPVQAIKAARSDFANIETFSGKTQAFNLVNVAAQVTGQITAINFTQGKMVKEGDVLFEVDSRKHVANLKIAEAQLAKDTAQLELLEKELVRYETLNAQKYVSDEQLDKARSNRDSLAATIASDQANIANAKLMLEYCSIKAPVSGVVGQINVNVGNIVQADGQTPITNIMQISPIYIVFEVDGTTLENLRKIPDISQLPVAIQTESGQEIKDVKLSFIDNNINPNSGSTDIKALYKNNDQLLWANQFVKVHLTMNINHDVIVLPIGALMQNQQGYFVFILDQNNIAHIRPVKVGAQDDTTAEILSGLNENELVVISGQLRLNEGTPVKLINQDVASK